MWEYLEMTCCDPTNLFGQSRQSRCYTTMATLGFITCSTLPQYHSSPSTQNIPLRTGFKYFGTESFPGMPTLMNTMPLATTWVPGRISAFSALLMPPSDLTPPRHALLGNPASLPRHLQANIVRCGVEQRPTNEHTSCSRRLHAHFSHRETFMSTIKGWGI